MDFILNELSIKQVNSIQEAENRYNIFYNLCINTKQYRCFNEKNRIFIEENNDIKSICLFKNYPFIQWISKLPRRNTEKNFFLKMLSDYYKPIIFPEYTYKDKEALGLGFAYKNNLTSISFNTSKEWNTCFIEVESLHIKNNKLQKNSKLKVKHLCSDNHIKCHKRIFKHHKKHNRNNPTKKESPLLYNPNDENDVKIIQNLLNCAVPIKKNSERLCFFDEKREKYIIFHPESKKKDTSYYNVFHAFHIEEDTIRIPQITKNRISEIMQKFK